MRSLRRAGGDGRDVCCHREIEKQRKNEGNPRPSFHRLIREVFFSYVGLQVLLLYRSHQI